MAGRNANESEPNALFTIGHSNRPLSEFVGALTAQAIKLVVDVRTVPRSRANPQYNRETLPQTLAEFEIGYEHIPALGGLRGKAADVPASTNAFWQNASFHNYADYAMTEPFRSGLGRLRALGHERRCVIMCAEAVWWRCHRRIITDYLIAADETVFHIFDSPHVERARMTPGAISDPDGTIVYPAAS
jgi:uncharacterized protein (DUF488 family)